AACAQDLSRSSSGSQALPGNPRPRGSASSGLAQREAEPPRSAFPGGAWEREVHAITTELEKIIPSLALCAAPPHCEPLYTTKLGQGSPRQPEFGRFFSGPSGAPSLPQRGSLCQPRLRQRFAAAGLG